MARGGIQTLCNRGADLWELFDARIRGKHPLPPGGLSLWQNIASPPRSSVGNTEYEFGCWLKHRPLMFRFCGAFPAGFILGKPEGVAQAKANLTGFISGPSKWNVSFWFPKAKQNGLPKPRHIVTITWRTVPSRYS